MLSAPFITGFSLLLTVTTLFTVVTLPSLSVTLYVNVYLPTSVVLTVPVTSILIIVTSSLSVALTPSKGLNVSPTFIVVSSAPFITGFSLLLTVTVLSTIVTLLSLSVTLYVNVYSPTSDVLTFPSTSIFDIVISSLSVAVTPSNGLNVSPTFIVISSAPCITGFSLLLTVTTLSTVVILLSVSVTLYISVYSPTSDVLTFPSTSILDIVISSLSVADTPSSGLNVSPTFIVISSALCITGFSLLLTVTILSTVVILPSLSVTLYVSVYSPTSDVLTLPVTSILDIVPSSLSVAVTPSNGLNVSPTFIVISFAPFITGLLLPLTLIFLIFVDELPQRSVALYSKTWFPLTEVSIVPFKSNLYAPIFSASKTVTPSNGLNSSYFLMIISSAP